MTLRLHQTMYRGCRQLLPRLLQHSIMKKDCFNHSSLLNSSTFQSKFIRQVNQRRFYCNEKTPGSVPLGKLQGSLNLIYSCGVCHTRNSHLISRQAYEKGVVIVTCSSCDNKHLIADHLDWFKDQKEKTIEEMMAKKGEVVLKVKPVSDKVFEYSE